MAVDAAHTGAAGGGEGNDPARLNKINNEKGET